MDGAEDDDCGCGRARAGDDVAEDAVNRENEI